MIREPEGVVLLDGDVLRDLPAGTVVYLREPDGTIREVSLRVGRGRFVQAKSEERDAP